MKTLSSINNHELKIVKYVLTNQNILEQLKLGPQSRDELVHVLNIPRTTIYDHLRVLMKRRIVIKETRQDGSKGRPKVYFKLKKGGSEHE